MGKMQALIFATTMLMACGGCFTGVDRDGYGDNHNRVESGERDHGGHGEHEGRR